MPGLTRRLLLAVLATLVSAVAASPAGAAGHTTRSVRTTTSANVGIVDIYTTLGYQDGAAAAGTGMLISRTGEVLTNNHVIRGATKFKVVDVTTHHSYNATVVGYSVAHDIAVLQLANASHMQTIKLGGYVKLHVGQQVVARGNAQGRGGAPKAARGQVIALHRKIVARDITGESETLHNVIATNTAVEPGDSGGPLEETHNRVIGMVTAGSTASASPAASRSRSGKRSVRANDHEGEVERDHPRRADGVPRRRPQGCLGRHSDPADPAEPAAAVAGLVAGDVITSLNGAPIASMSDVREAMLSLVVGTAVSIGWTDTNGVAQTGTITPASGPPQ